MIYFSRYSGIDISFGVIISFRIAITKENKIIFLNKSILISIHVNSINLQCTPDTKSIDFHFMQVLFISVSYKIESVIRLNKF